MIGTLDIEIYEKAGADGKGVGSGKISCAWI